MPACDKCVTVGQANAPEWIGDGLLPDDGSLTIALRNATGALLNHKHAVARQALRVEGMLQRADLPYDFAAGVHFVDPARADRSVVLLDDQRQAQASLGLFKPYQIYGRAVLLPPCHPVVAPLMSRHGIVG